MLFEKRQADEKKTKRYVTRFDFGFGMCFRGIGYAGLVRFESFFGGWKFCWRKESRQSDGFGR